MTTLHHEAIAASAGSGKTFQLAHRYIKLLTRGVSPERICALTFSRKAAGEIFDHLVRYLIEASASEDGAKRNRARGILQSQHLWEYPRPYTLSHGSYRDSFH